MIRRGFWLVAGAALGVTGYRRATRLARMLTGSGSGPPGRSPSQTGRSPGQTGRSPGQTGRSPGQTGRWPGPVGRAAGSPPSAGLMRDPQVVRLPDGPGRAGQPGSRSASPGAVARIAAAASFVRDVRAGMAEYLDLHHRELARNLGSRRDRISSG